MSDAMSAELMDWIGRATGGRVVAANRDRTAESREAWSVDVERRGRLLAMFCLRDGARDPAGSLRDAAVLRALCGTAIPVPEVFAVSDGLGALLVARMPGYGDFPEAVPEAEREPAARDLMRVVAALHALEPRTLAIAHLGVPPDAASCAALQLALVDARLAGLESDELPLLLFAREWLARNAAEARRTSLVHGDPGPGNFLCQRGVITALIDWRLAHWGDPMEDLAAISVRDMARPIGPLPRRFREYEQSGGTPVDLASVRWYRVLVLAGWIARIALRLSGAAPGAEREPLERWRVLLMRALALCLARETEQALGFADAMLELGRREATRLGPLAHRLPQPLEPV
jgi:aminoglycoside phosphotransferase (APT) family kinase protein